MNEQNNFEFPPFLPATNLKEVRINFDPTRAVDPDSEYYIPRTDPQLGMLSFELEGAHSPIHAFLCGHRGSGKTTELKRLCMDPKIITKYFPIFLTTQEFGIEAVHLTHDAVLVEIGLELKKEGKAIGLDPKLGKELENWGKEIVKTFLHNEKVEAEVGAKAGAWSAYFKAQLGTRREWKREEKQILEPRVQDLIGILNRMAMDLKNKTGKQLLVVVDDLEKGESGAHKEMHKRLFQENYDTLVKPRFSIIYTLPIYYRAMPESRIPLDEVYAFSAIRLYSREDKNEDSPPMDKDGEGYILMRRFIEKRLASPKSIFAEGVQDELLRIGGGLFRETARAIRESAYFALSRGGSRIGIEEVENVYNQVKKEYQPIIRGEAVRILKNVLESEEGWVPGVEPYLQSRAVVAYENGDLWIDVRHVLKPYVRKLKITDG